jgi:hypothetical protein
MDYDPEGERGCGPEDYGEYLDDLAERQDFAQDDMYQREDYGDWGYEGMHEE